jgi:tRNA pseudouridine55 synthase
MMKLSDFKFNDPQSGILLVDKPPAWTSHDVVNFVRRRYGFKKVGHCGTLDPSATGLLVLVIGTATKLAEYLATDNKTYRTVMTFGASTSSHDADGDIIEEKSVDHLTEENVRSALEAYQGEQLQIPPMVSAVKKNGKKLYELARKGIEIEREPRKITIHDLIIHSIDLPEVEFTLDCSKGTYVRTVCHDLAISLGTVGHMSSLVREKSGGFDLKDACEVADMKQWEIDDILKRIIPIAQVVQSKLSELSN